MATSQDHFALDWIKGELFETLNSAREELEEYVESDGDETRIRACLTSLHQVHGTLVMLELEGVTLLADSLELLAQSMMDGKVDGQAAASQTLMQGILELPGHIDEIQQGQPDSVQNVIKLVNEARTHLGEPPVGGVAAKIDAAASDSSISRFEKIDGVEKVRKIRAAYQQVLLSILKGQDLAGSLGMLGKVAQGLERVCEGTPHTAQWQAFAEFVASLHGVSGPLPGAAVKLLRRVDSEIRFLAQQGSAALKKPVVTELVQQLVAACRERGHDTARLGELEAALNDTEDSGGLLISGRQALASAAGALREELVLLKDQLDLSVRADQGAPEDLVSLIAPLKQIGSTLSLLGFESSKSIIADQIDVLNQATEGHALDQSSLLAVASALVQVDENLASFTQSGKGEVEKITDDAERAVTVEARQGIELVKQSIVDFVSSKWDPRHLEQTQSQLASICGALDMIPLPRASRLLASCSAYITEELGAGRTPTWEELDHFADAISGVDYYLERLAEESSVGAEDILELVDRSLQTLGVTDSMDGTAGSATLTDLQFVPAATDAVENEEATETELPTASSIEGDIEPSAAKEPSAEPSATEEEEPSATEEEEPSAAKEPSATIEEPSATEEEEPSAAKEPSATIEEPSADKEPSATEDKEPSADNKQPLEPPDHKTGTSEVITELPEGERPEPKLEMDDDPGFDLGNLEFSTPDLIPDALAEDFAAEAEAEVPAVPMSSSIAPPTNPSLVDTFETDAEIVEIFVEEVDEVLESIAQWLPQWREELNHEEALSEVRRAFHTLKGSGRIVGANVIGELAWSVENMLNRIIDGTVVPTAQFVDVVDDARMLVPRLRDAFEVQRGPELDTLSAIMERADVLASGGALEDSEPSVAVPEPEAPEANDSLTVFLGEATKHMVVLNRSIEDGGVALNADSLRALHTMAGSAGMAGIETVASLTRPTYELAQVLRQDTDTLVGGDEAVFFSQAYAALEGILDDLQHDREPEEYAQLIADADHLLMLASADPELEARSKARETLLGLDGLSVVMDASEFLQNWQSGALDLEYSDKLAAALTEVATTARATERVVIAELADTLASAHAYLGDDLLSDRGLAILSQGHERLLAMFDALAADESLDAADDVIIDLERLLQDAQQPDEVAEEPTQQAKGRVEDDEAASPDQENDAAAADDTDAQHLDLTAELSGEPVEEESVEDISDDLLIDDTETPNLFGLDDAADEEIVDEESEEHSLAMESQAELEGADSGEPGNILTFPITSDNETGDGDSIDEFSLDELGKDFFEGLEEPSAGKEPSADKEPSAGKEPSAEPSATEEEEPSADKEPSAEPSATEEKEPSADKEPSVTNTVQPAAAPELDPAIAQLLPEDLDEEIIEIFFEEADELLEALDENVHQWTSEPGNRLFVEHMLRSLHTLKGGARLAGLVKLGDVTHQLESFLIDFQSGAAETSNEFFSSLAARFDELSSLLSVIKAALAGEVVSWAGLDEQQPEQIPEAAAEAEVSDVTPAAEQVGGISEEVPEAVSADESRTTEVSPAIPLKPAAPESRPVAESAEARDKAERASQEMVRVGSGLLENLVNLAGESSIVRARIEQGMSDFTSALDEMETTIERVREQLRRLEIETEAQILFRQDRPDGPSYEEFDPLEMDRYSQLQQLSKGLSESASDMLDLKDTLLFKARESETLLLQQARINTELQEGLMRTRMVPFSRLLPRLRRIVRQVSGELGKEVEFHAFNAEGELDRNLLERMVPPLEHMLRNAVDHGIETKELRKNYGKPATGRIDLRLSREGGDVVIEIADDGAGIDVESVRAKAVERGLMAEGAKLRDDEISQFVLAPGFTTAKSITQISGRGVGMDVVHSEVKQLGGSIQIASRQGKGSRFIVRVPFTVSVNRALMVSVGDDYYAIPLNTIEGIVLLSPAELERLYAPEGNTFEYAGIPYRVRYLGHYLGREFRASALQSSVPVVLVRSGDHAVAVHVDGVQGSREIVVKSLGPQFAGVGGISGATILGDGSVVVILDLLALIRAQSSGGQAGSRRPAVGGSRTRTVMVVDDSVTVRKVTSRLLERQGMDVMVAKDGIEAISLLQERRPDVMLLDIEMPRMDGFEVARQVRHDDRLADLPIIMISSRTGEKHQEHAVQLGVNSFLGKPFQENELLATIDRLVN